MTQTQIIIYGTSWCGGSRRARLLFDRFKIPYTWIDLEQDPEAARYVESVNRGCRSVPTILWPDGTLLVEPSEDDLLKKLGVQIS
jgi:mycoredoxin